MTSPTPSEFIAVSEEFRARLDDHRRKKPEPSNQVPDPHFYPKFWNGVRNKIEMTSILNPASTNASAIMAHGGNILKLMDEAAAVVAFRHCRAPVVTVSIDRVDFIAPIFLGDLIIVRAMLAFVSPKSMEVVVQVVAENLLTGEVRKTNTGVLSFVRISTSDATALPCPPLVPEADDEKTLFEEGRQRYQTRKAERERSRLPPSTGFS